MNFNGILRLSTVLAFYDSKSSRNCILSSIISVMMMFDGCQFGFLTWSYLRLFDIDHEAILCIQNNSTIINADTQGETFRNFIQNMILSSDKNSSQEYDLEDFLYWISLIFAFLHCCLCFSLNSIVVKKRSFQNDFQSFAIQETHSEERSF